MSPLEITMLCVIGAVIVITITDGIIEGYNEAKLINSK